MRDISWSKGSTGIANIAAATALQRYAFERDAASAWIRQIQLNGIATKEDWLDFSEKIRIAADRCFQAASEAQARPI